MIKKRIGYPLSFALLGLSSFASAAPLPANDFIAHEWGTFTSLQDSDGNTAEGMYHGDEEEQLPSFVHGRASDLPNHELNTFAELDGDKPRPRPSKPDGGCRGKCIDFEPIAGTPMTITQKMETPVIYFYSKEARSIKVDVDFPGGIISQYYPNASSFSPELGKVEAVANGHVSWNVDILTEQLPIPSVSPTNIWQPSRQVGANTISVDGENEKFIFYRGLGNFKVPFQVSDNTNDGIHLYNHSPQKIAQAFFLVVTDSGAAIKPLGAIAAQGQLILSPDSIENLELNTLETYLNQASKALTDALLQEGLYYDEALAMVNTWKKSYFLTPGMRVLYVLPREWTESLLPLTISPQPKELVRTLVGRVEIMTHQEEQKLYLLLFS